MIINENYIEFLISFWRNVPVVNTKLYRFSTRIDTWVNCSPCCKLKCLIVNVLRYCTLKFWLLIDKLKVHATSGSGAGVTSFGRSLLSGGSLLSGFTSSHKKLTLIFFFGGGGSLLSELYGMSFILISQEEKIKHSLETFWKGEKCRRWF